MKPYTIPQARQVISEMSADLSLQLVKRHALTNQIALLLSYDVKSISYASNYHGPIVTDFYGRQVPKPDHGGANLPDLTSSPGSCGRLFGPLRPHRQPGPLNP
ncbi:MAG: hypothetical protein ACFWUH_01600 [Limosilactobacillus fermentum]|jgi:DNA polymerase V